MPPIPSLRCAPSIRSTVWIRSSLELSAKTVPTSPIGRGKVTASKDEVAEPERALERYSLSYRSIDCTETLLPVAGVLLGKTSLDWLYGPDRSAATNRVTV